MTTREIDYLTFTYLSFFFFNDTAPPDISPLSLHDPLPILLGKDRCAGGFQAWDFFRPPRLASSTHPPHATAASNPDPVHRLAPWPSAAASCARSKGSAKLPGLFPSRGNCGLSKKIVLLASGLALRRHDERSQAAA